MRMSEFRVMCACVRACVRVCVFVWACVGVGGRACLASLPAPASHLPALACACLRCRLFIACMKFRCPRNAQA